MQHEPKLPLATAFGTNQIFATGSLGKYRAVQELHPELTTRIGMVSVAPKEELVVVTGVQTP